MSVSRSLLVFALVVAVFTRRHRIVEVVSYRFLYRVPLRKVVFDITGMASDAAQPLRFVDIRFRAPLSTSFPTIRCGVAGPAILIEGLSNNLEAEIFEIRHLLPGVVDRNLLCSGVPFFLLC